MVSQLEEIFSSIPEPKNENSTNKKPLLIIDDNQEVIDALTVILSRDYELLVCNSYSEVEQKGIDRIPVALLDIKMAYKDGIEVFYLLKAKYPCIKIIFHSAYPGNDEQARLTESLPCCGYLTKGEYDIHDLLATIENAF
jgi:CheY-like chemotaxis protein